MERCTQNNFLEPSMKDNRAAENCHSITVWPFQELCDKNIHDNFSCVQTHPHNRADITKHTGVNDILSIVTVYCIALVGGGPEKATPTVPFFPSSTK